MDNKKDNRYYIKKIITDLSFILEHTKELTKRELEENDISELLKELEKIWE